MNESTESAEPSDVAATTAEGATAAEPQEFSSELVASLWPWGDDESTADVEIVVYVVTGRHGGLTIPERFCRECHRFAHAADVAAEQVDADVNVRVVSWWTHLPSALRHGGYHAPVMVVGGSRLCQGYDVPTPERVIDAIEEALR